MKSGSPPAIAAAHKAIRPYSNTGGLVDEDGDTIMHDLGASPPATSHSHAHREMTSASPANARHSASLSRFGKPSDMPAPGFDILGRRDSRGGHQPGMHTGSVFQAAQQGVTSPDRIHRQGTFSGTGSRADEGMPHLQPATHSNARFLELMEEALLGEPHGMQNVQAPSNGYTDARSHRDSRIDGSPSHPPWPLGVLHNAPRPLPRWPPEESGSLTSNYGMPGTASTRSRLRVMPTPSTGSEYMVVGPSLQVRQPHQPFSVVADPVERNRPPGPILPRRLSQLPFLWGGSESNPVAPLHTPRQSITIDTVTRSCTACMDDVKVSNLTTLPCRCDYCTACLNRLFQAGCASAADFPPKCHGQALRLSAFGMVLEQNVIERYKDVEAEFGSRDALYCAVPLCSTFIDKSNISSSDKGGFCLKCGQYTCTKCKKLDSDHTYEGTTRACPAHTPNELALWALSDSRDWRQCPSCQMMVEKMDGCDHISCVCGVEFCYTCGSFFDEDDLCDCGSRSDDDDFAENFQSGDESDDEHDETMHFSWPDHHKIFEGIEGQRCQHLTQEPAKGSTCHGCLELSPASALFACMNCQAELCEECLSLLAREFDSDEEHDSTDEDYVDDGEDEEQDDSNDDDFNDDDDDDDETDDGDDNKDD